MMRFLIARTDNIGDLILSLPVAGILKQTFPESKVWFLAREYTQFIVEACPFVDGYLNWDELKALPPSVAAGKIKALQFDTFFSLFPNKQIAQLAKISQIKQRIGTSRRIYHWFTCNRLINFSRKKSALHEIQLNTILLKALGIKQDLSQKELMPYLQLRVEQNASIASMVDPKRFNLIIHPGSNGNGREWPLPYFIKLIQQLAPQRFQIFVTGTAKEQERFQQLFISCPHVNNKIGQFSLKELTNFINACDGLLAASTGPLHIAAALGKHTLGFYAPKPLINPKRWAPIGVKAEFLVVDKDCSRPCREGACPCMEEISVETALNRVLDWEKNRAEP